MRRGGDETTRDHVRIPESDSAAAEASGNCDSPALTSTSVFSSGRAQTRSKDARNQVVVEGINITNLGYNHKAVEERKADLVFFQEHKLRGEAVTKMKKILAKAGWNMQCGPCDPNTKKPNAGVGVAEKEQSKLNVVQAERKASSFQAAWQLGRVEKYEVDLGWGSNLMVYVPYGKSGGAKADKDLANSIIEAIREEIATEYHKPTIIIGDFNVEPATLRAVGEMIEQEQWIDVGANASWWGGRTGNPPARPDPKQSPRGSTEY